MSSNRACKYKLTNVLREHTDKPVYCVCFNKVDGAHDNVFATCGARRVSVYECQDQGATRFVQGYLDESEAEEFHALSWTIQESTGAPMLLAGGKLGVIRVLNCNSQSLIWTAVGHGGAINDITVHPSHPDLFLTASRDSALRLWNIKTSTCVLIVKGDGSHTSEVLCVDFHPIDNYRFVSGGMDDSIKIWWLRGNDKDIIASYKYDPKSGRSFHVGHLATPVFSTRKVHWNYVDCVKWMGDLILSKSVNNKILMWQPLGDEGRNVTRSSGPRYDPKGRFSLIQEFDLVETDIWFMRFSVDPSFRWMACGSRTGKVFVWDLLASEGAERAKATMKIGSRESVTIRQTAVSEDGKIVLACCENSTVYRFDVQGS